VTTASVVSNSCRLTIMSATMRVDLAVPVHISIAELLAIVLSSLGREVADQGAADGGWVLQRDGEPPLDFATTVAACQLRDGDILHLRTRATSLPEVAFDDVLDAVATGVRTRTIRWQPVHTARAAATGTAVLLTFALAMLLAAGPRWTLPAVCCGVGAVLLILTAVAVGRVFHRRGPALTAAASAVAYAFASGAIAVAGRQGISHFGAPQILVGSCAALLAGAVLLVTLGAGLAGFVAVITVGLLAAIGTGIATATTLSAAGTAAVVATIGLALSPILPALAFRLSRLELPTIPTDAADLRRDTATLDAQRILGQAVRADAFLTGLIGGLALSLAGAAVIISQHGVSERILSVVVGLICLLRARLFSGRSQRAVLLAAGFLSLLAVLVTGAISTHGLARIVGFAIPAAVVAMLLSALAVSLPGRRYAPPMSRAADLLEALLVLSVIPLALAVMGVYGAIRGAVG
jgi:type VII secretion integral membrane protein EccD